MPPSSSKSTKTKTMREITLSKGRRDKLEAFCQSLGIKMNDYHLLDLALTHTSFAHETAICPRNHHNERLEFLGDSVLSLVVSTYMYNNFGRYDEGKMTKLRAQVVCETSLYRLAVQMHIGDYLRLGHGEMTTGGRERPSILADAFEAVLGAYYLDQGYEAARKYVLGLMQQEIDAVCNGMVMLGDYKSMLQEYVQQDSPNADITYEIIGFEGPEHNRTFKAAVNLDGRRMGEGTGRTKKEAEQQAAHEAMQRLKQNKNLN